MDLSVFPRLDPLGRPPEGGDPADRFTKRLPGPPTTRSSNFPVQWARARRPPTRRIFPAEGFLADWIHPPEGFRIPWLRDPKTEFHDDKVKQNSKIDNKKFRFGAIFLWVISRFSKSYPQFILKLKFLV